MMIFLTVVTMLVPLIVCAMSLATRSRSPPGTLFNVNGPFPFGDALAPPSVTVLTSPGASPATLPGQRLCRTAWAEAGSLRREFGLRCVNDIERE